MYLVSLWRRANTRNVRLYYPYRQYTNLFIVWFVSEHCLRSTLRLFACLVPRRLTKGRGWARVDGKRGAFVSFCLKFCVPPSHQPFARLPPSHQPLAFSQLPHLCETPGNEAGLFAYIHRQVCTIEIIDIECGLLSRVSQKIVATKWRIYKGKISSPQDILCKSKR